MAGIGMDTYEPEEKKKNTILKNNVNYEEIQENEDEKKTNRSSVSSERSDFNKSIINSDSFPSEVPKRTFKLSKPFSEDICTILKTASIDIEVLEIADCKSLPNYFPKILKKLVNLRSLRLENCCNGWEEFAEDYFEVIISMKKLKNLELINIEFNDCVSQCLAKCDGITALLIIPMYVRDLAKTNCRLLDCLGKLSKTLTHVVWGVTHRVLYVADLDITYNIQNQHTHGYSMGGSQTRESKNNIPILRPRKLQPQPKDLQIPEIDKDKSDDIHVWNLSSIQNWLNSAMENAKTKVIKMPFSKTTDIHLSEQFDDL